MVLFSSYCILHILLNAYIFSKYNDKFCQQTIRSCPASASHNFKLASLTLSLFFQCLTAKSSDSNCGIRDAIHIMYVHYSRHVVDDSVYLLLSPITGKGINLARAQWYKVVVTLFIREDEDGAQVHRIPQNVYLSSKSDLHRLCLFSALRYLHACLCVGRPMG